MRTTGMDREKQRIELLILIVISIAFSLFLTGCQSGDTLAEAHESQQSEELAKVSGSEERVTLLRGETITVRLSEGLGSAKNQTGDRFMATVDEIVTLKGPIAVPEGTEVQGILRRRDVSGRGEGRSEMTLELEEISLNGSTYPLKSEPVRYYFGETPQERAENFWNGSAVGAGAGTGMVPAEKGQAVEFVSGERLAFTMNEAVELPMRLLFSISGDDPGKLDYAPSDRKSGEREDRAERFPEEARKTRDRNDVSEMKRPLHASERGRGESKASQRGQKKMEPGHSQGYAFGKDQEEHIRNWFSDERNRAGLPPGLAKRESLPPGLQKQLQKNGTLPPGLQKRLQTLPQPLEDSLPRLPIGLKRRIIGDDLLLIEEVSGMIVDIIDGVF